MVTDVSDELAESFDALMRMTAGANEQRDERPMPKAESPLARWKREADEQKAAEAAERARMKREERQERAAQASPTNAAWAEWAQRVEDRLARMEAQHVDDRNALSELASASRAFADNVVGKLDDLEAVMVRLRKHYDKRPAFDDDGPLDLPANPLRRVN